MLGNGGQYCQAHRTSCLDRTAPEGFLGAQEELQAGHARVEGQLVASQVQLGQCLADQAPNLRSGRGGRGIVTR